MRALRLRQVSLNKAGTEWFAAMFVGRSDQTTTTFLFFSLFFLDYSPLRHSTRKEGEPPTDIVRSKRYVFLDAKIFPLKMCTVQNEGLYLAGSDFRDSSLGIV